MNIEELLGEIAADAPCGEDLEYDPAFTGLEKLAQGTPERQYGGTIIPAESPDWRSVRETALALFDRHALAGDFGTCREHLDVRFVAVVPRGEQPAVSEESLDVRWWQHDV